MTTQTKIEEMSCPKCGHKDIRGPEYTGKDRLKYVCRRCVYQWTTPCLDAEQTKARSRIAVPFLHLFRKKKK